MNRAEAEYQISEYLDEIDDTYAIDLFNQCCEANDDASLMIYFMETFDDIIGYKFNATPWEIVNSLNKAFDVTDDYFSWRGDVSNGGIVSYSDLTGDQYSPFDKQLMIDTMIELKESYGDVYIEDIITQIEED